MSEGKYEARYVLAEKQITVNDCTWLHILYQRALLAIIWAGRRTVNSKLEGNAAISKCQNSKTHVIYRVIISIMLPMKYVS